MTFGAPSSCRKISEKQDVASKKRKQNENKKMGYVRVLEKIPEPSSMELKRDVKEITEMVRDLGSMGGLELLGCILKLYGDESKLRIASLAMATHTNTNREERVEEALLEGYRGMLSIYKMMDYSLRKLYEEELPREK